MELSHSFTVPARVDVAWATFMDLERVGGCFPGATVTEVTDSGFSGTVKVKLGPIALLYAGSGTFAERDDGAHRAVIEAKGKDKRGNGTAGATVTIQLTADGETTRADVTTDLAITGKPAQFGRGVMQDVSDKLLQQFVACIESQFDAAPAPESPPKSAPEALGAASESAGSPALAAVPDSSPASGSGRPPVSRVASATSDDALDLGATVLPVMLRTYGPYAVAGLVGVLLGVLLGRRGRS